VPFEHCQMNENRLPLFRSWRTAFAALALIALAACDHAPPAAAGTDDAACPVSAGWFDPAAGSALGADAVLADLAAKRVVLLGESHDDAEHHLWQAQTLAALQSRRPATVVAFEMFPRRAQPVLDKWTAGELSADEFLKQSEWSEVWGFGAEMYMPLFQLARMNGLKMVGANVERALVRRVGQEGWAKVPEAEREGVGTPAPAADSYKRSLAGVYRGKMAVMAQRGHGGGETKADGITLDDVLADDGFKNFVAAQLTWDRAMAEAMAKAARDNPNALVVGIVGRGHAEFGHGIPHQLRDLGVADVAVALPVHAARCANLPKAAADVAFVIPASPEEDRAEAPKKPKLGVYIGPGEGGVAVTKVVEGSIAERAGIEAKDVIVRAAGSALEQPGDLVAVIQRQAPGTWLPLEIRRGSERHDLVAKFPALPKSHP
jgi:uncharacterized iron-regulated protein